MLQKFKWTSYALLIFFAAFIWGYSLVDVFVPGREYSEMENRYLKQAPRFTLRALINNTYTMDVETFTNDQFVLRDSWITLKSLCETALGKVENNGIVYGADGYMFEKRLSVDEEQLEKNVSSLIEFTKKFPDKYIDLMLVPTSDAILTDKLPKGIHNIDQEELIHDIGWRVYSDENSFRFLEIFPQLKKINDKYIYYRTDHHWTTAGAHRAYEYYMSKLERKYVSLFSLNKANAHEVSDFYGTYYSKAKLFSAVPDIITWYDIPVKSVTINGEAVDGLYDKEKFEVRDKYAAFLRGNNGITAIESDCNLNRDENKKSKILVFKDSFGNSFAPFLAYSFDEITVVDLRYFNEVETLVTQGDFDNILVLYSFPTFAQETSIVNLKL